MKAATEAKVRRGREISIVSFPVGRHTVVHLVSIVAGGRGYDNGVVTLPILPASSRQAKSAYPAPIKQGPSRT